MKKWKHRFDTSLFRRDVSGNIAIGFAVVTLPLFAALGSAVDYSSLYNERVDLQEAADAAALFSAGEADPENIDMEALKVKANQVVQSRYGSKFAAISLDLQQTDTKVTVSLDKPYDTSFLRLLGLNEIDISVVSEATYSAQQDAPFCILATQDRNSGFVKDGSGDLIAQDCGIRVNSADTIDAMAVSGSGNIDADNLCITGRLEKSGSGSFSQGTTLREGCAPTPNPFTRTKVFPSAPTIASSPACNFFNHEVRGSASATISPGVYCGDTDLRGSGDITFLPGDYYFLNGSVTIQGSGSQKFASTAKNVTFINAPLELRGGGDTDFGDGNLTFVNSDAVVKGSSELAVGAGNHYFYNSDLTLEGSGDISFGPGSFNFDTSRFIVDGSSDFVAKNVYYYFKNNGSGFEFEGSGMQALTAPTNGDFAGILIYFDPNITTGTNTLEGSGNTLFDGVVNAAGSDIEISGSGSQINANADLSVFVANKITRSGSGDFVFRVNPNAPFIPGELITDSGDVQVYLSR